MKNQVPIVRVLHDGADDVLNPAVGAELGRGEQEHYEQQEDEHRSAERANVETERDRGD